MKQREAYVIEGRLEIGGLLLRRFQILSEDGYYRLGRVTVERLEE